ncbi:MAG: hypothetical protein K8F36_02310 [Melioribacteraceae bacterium]|nr:hypothetical protein [Melioribacteraceae bacterium]
MQRLFSIITIILLFFFVACDKEDSPSGPEVPQPESTVMTVSSTAGGTTSTNSGISISVIAGTVPENSQGESASVTFSIESPVEAPAALPSGGQFIGSPAKFGPEGFNFRWPVKMSLPYPEDVNPSAVYVVYYNALNEEWLMIPKAEVDASARLIYFDALNLGIYSLATFPASAKFTDDRTDYDGGFEYQGSPGYYYTLTVASVSNYKYPYQMTWPGNPPIGHTGSSGSYPAGGPRQPTHIILVQATYQIWITRTTPGTMSTLPRIETYTVPASGTISRQVTWTGPLSNGDGWTSLQLPGGGEWVEGRPNGWPVPTVTYGTGDFQATLTWVNNSSHTTDVDLHLYGPNGMHVYYGAKTSADGSLQLDRDWRSAQGTATENIYSLGAMPTGAYEIKVVLFSGDATSFNCRVINAGTVNTVNGSLNSNTTSITVAQFTR